MADGAEGLPAAADNGAAAPALPLNYEPSQADTSLADAFSAGMTLDEKYDLVRSIGEECITEEKLRNWLAKKPNPICYDGFEPSGRMHIAQVFSMEELVADYESGALHPGDLKPALSKALNAILQDHF